jgi:glycosyltransferase involved in cell wall biosynthesis
MPRTPTVALDFTTLDHLSLGNGQYRYVVDLVRGLAALAPPCRFVLLGSRADPVPELADVFTARGGAWQYRPMPRASGRLAYYREHALVALALRRAGADLYHGLHSFVPLPCPCPAVTTKYDLMVELFPEYEATRRSRPYRLYRWAVRNQVRRVIAISQTTADDLSRRWGVDRRRIDTVPLGSGPLRGGPATPPAGAPAGRPFILSPYNLEPRKNLAALVEAFARVRPAFPGLRLVLFGKAAWSAEREAAFEADVRARGLATDVDRVGRVSDGELAWLYRHAGLFVFPSLYEGFGLPVVEAMADGACVVARGASAMAEVVGDAGALTETRNPAALADCLAGLLRSPERRAALGAAARERAATFSVERMARETYQSYRRALAPGAEAGRPRPQLVGS